MKIREKMMLEYSYIKKEIETIKKGDGDICGVLGFIFFVILLAPSWALGIILSASGWYEWRNARRWKIE